jgi:hypothetical protein
MNESSTAEISASARNNPSARLSTTATKCLARQKRPAGRGATVSLTPITGGAAVIGGGTPLLSESAFDGISSCIILTILKQIFCSVAMKSAFARQKRLATRA